MTFSSRTELAGLVLALGVSGPIRVAIDNKTVVDKANLLLDNARSMQAKGNVATARPTKNVGSSRVMATSGGNSGLHS